MITISVNADVRALTRHLHDVQRNQIPFATTKALTLTAKDVQDAIPAALERDFEQPTPFTKRGTFRLNATKRKLIATIGFKDKQAAYLLPNIEGGRRGLKPIEKRLRKPTVGLPPRRTRKNPYGNLSKSQNRAIIEASKETNTDDSVKRYFSGQPRHRPDLPPGIYARVNKNKKIVPLLIFATGATYQKRFSLSGLAEHVVRSRFGAQFQKALSEALASAR